MTSPSSAAGWRDDGVRRHPCGVHPDVAEAARCGDCQRGMCRLCFDEAPWPWKACASCHAARMAAGGAPPAR